MYGLLIQEIARARHEERLCGIPGPKFRRRRRRRPPEYESVNSQPRRRSAPWIGPRTPVRI